MLNKWVAQGLAIRRLGMKRRDGVFRRTTGLGLPSRLGPRTRSLGLIESAYAGPTGVGVPKAR
jgi:hypothetical protein